MVRIITKYKHSLLFLFLFCGICLYYSYPTLFHYGPRSTHQWRQTDSASLALNYYQNGMHFFQPRLHHELSGGGYCAAGGEAPLSPYLAALSYKLLSPKEGYFRLINLLILGLGLWAFSHLLLLIVQDLFISLLLPALIFSSPLLAFYGFNFVPNAPALGLVLLAWYFFYRYIRQQRLVIFYLSMMAFAVAGLFKVSALISFLVLPALWMLQALKYFLPFEIKPVFRAGWKVIPGLLLVPLPALLWMQWADSYNALHQASYFAARIKPLWDLDRAAAGEVFKTVLRVWSWSYFHLSVHLLVIFLSLFLAFRKRGIPVMIRWTFWLLFAGVILYGLLWYQRFEDHDYYAIDLLVYPAFVLTAALIYLKKNYRDAIRHPAFRIVLLLLVIFNIRYAKQELKSRYAPDSPFMEHFNPSFYQREALAAFLKKLDIQYPDKVISFPDQSPNNSLYYLNLRGWSGLYMGGALPPQRVESFIQQGARYLILNKASWLQNEALQPFFAKEVGIFDNSIYVFDLRGWEDRRLPKKEDL